MADNVARRMNDQPFVVVHLGACLGPRGGRRGLQWSQAHPGPRFLVTKPVLQSESKSLAGSGEGLVYPVLALAVQSKVGGTYTLRTLVRYLSE